MNNQRGLHLLFILCIQFLSLASLNGQTYWSEWNEDGFAPSGPRYIQPIRYRTAVLNVPALSAELRKVPLELSQEASESVHTITIPAPDGSVQTFQIVESPVMHPDLQAKYPEIRCYTGFNIERPNERLKCDLTPHGFHAMVIGAQGGAWFVDPYSMNDTEHYTVYKKADYQKQTDEDFVCHVADHDNSLDKSFEGTPEAGDCKFRSYRLALACTGEYGTFHGGTVPLALAAMNTSVNRVNSVYERDHAVRMVLIANNNLLIYFNGSTDPYSNNNGSAMLGENQANVTTIIGGSNYDIGHVFSTGGGGIASLGAVCSATNKARGVTGASQPIGDPFDIDYVVHEMGHQFAENHTFYNSCGGNKTSAAAFEPGSGSTIMAYAGICPPNVQNNSDDYFHARSLQETATFVAAGGNACANQIPITNAAPTVEAGANYTIPGGTPFALTAVGFDSDAANVLTYCWEQMNNDGSFTQPPAAANAGGPMFRSYDPNPAPVRYFPRLQNVIANTTNQWEVLPTVNRTLNFRVTVRDNAVPAGCTGEDNMVVTVNGAAGPFVVTAPNTNVTWNVGENQTVTWNVAGTDAAPINTAQVRISLSTDGGLTFPIILADAVPNNGSAVISVPNAVANTCRVKVEGRGNVYYDMSNVNFRIQLPPIPTFVLATTLPQSNICPGQTFVIQVEASSVLGFNTPVNLNVTGLPSGVTATYSANPITPTGTSIISLNGFSAANQGAVNLTITGIGGTITQTSNQNLQVLSGAPAASNTRNPSHLSIGVATAPSLVWESSPLASMYQVQLATNVAFAAGDIIRDQNVPGTSLMVNGLLPTTVYFWRVRTINDCGISAWSAIAAFQTAACASFTNNTPVLIPDVAGQATSTLACSGGTIADVNIQLNITHSWVGDIDAKLTSPNGTTVTLFDRPGVPASQYGCDGDNLIVTLDDQAANSAAQLEGACSTTPPAISGMYKPLTALSGFNNSNASGSWTLAVTDYLNNDGGSITSWDIQVCFSTSNSNLAVVTNQALQVGQGQSGVIGTSLLSATSSNIAPSAIRFMLLSAPANGVLSLNGSALGLGGTFTQADINAGLVRYQHGTNAAVSDQFNFQVTELNGSGWVTAGTFQISILLNTLSASAVLTQNMNCFNQNNAIITVNASGGNGGLTYNLNGGAFQSSNVFSGLGAGTYSIMVRDLAGFTLTTNQLTVNNPNELTIGATVNGSEITINAGGGTGALQYAINGGAPQSSNVFGGLNNGVYTCAVIDANGCTKTTQAVVAVNSLVTGVVIQSNISCHGQTNGVITASVGGGQAPYTYTLQPTGTVQVDNATFTGLAAGTYSVSVQDVQGFSATTNQVILNAPAQLVATASSNLNTITVDAMGGTGSLTYSISGGAPQNSNTFSGLQNNTYTILVQDANGCQTSTSATVNVAPLGVTAQTSGQIACFGLSTGVITANAVGGISPYNFQINGGSTQISNTFSGLPAGLYTVGVLDASGAVSTTQVSIGEPAQLVASSAVVLNSITITAAGGTSPYVYTLNGNMQTSPVFPGLSNGAYSILVTDANGCTTQVGANVNVPALSGSSVYSGTIACFGNTTLTLTINAAGGIPPYNYALNGGAPQTDNVFTGLGAGAHTVIITDSQGRTFTVNSTGTGPAAVNAMVAVNSDTATVTATGGTPPYTYSLNGGASQSSPSFGPLPSGNYPGILVTDANNCSVTTPAFTIISGTEDLAELFGMTISPNPGSGLFMLQLAEGATETLRVTVIDMSGRRTILHQEIAQGNSLGTVDLSTQAAGNYLLQVIGKSTQASTILVVQR
jgi:subtilisin-like proprotein convertase family protein